MSKETKITEEEKVNYLVAILRTLDAPIITDNLQNLGYWDDETFVTNDWEEVSEIFTRRTNHKWEMNIPECGEFYFVTYDTEKGCYKVSGTTDSENYEETLKLKEIAEDMFSQRGEPLLKKFITWFKENEDLMDGTDFILNGKVYAGAELIYHIEEAIKKTFDFVVTVNVSATDFTSAVDRLKFGLKAMKDGGTIDDYTIS